MSDKTHSETLSRRHRQLLRQGDSGRIRQRVPAGDSAEAGDDADRGRTDQLIDERFRLLERLGSGRLGEIYEARIDAGPEISLDRIVALQLFDRRIAADPALIEKLRRGYAALRAGPHRNIVRLEELGRDRKTWYLVMERLEGVSLRFVLDDIGPLPLDEAMATVRSVGDALSYLHAKGMVHGAVTPSAVFVTENYGVRLLDIIPALPPSELPAESAPDSNQAGAPSPADDVYGLACLTYELLTGRHPYNYSTDVEARRLGLTPAVIDGLPPMRWQALARGLATDPEQRPGNVAVFLLDLGTSGRERLGASARAGGMGAAATSNDMPPVVATARDRLAMAATPEEAGGSRWFWPVFGAAVVGFLAAVVWVYQVPIRDVVIGQLAAVGLDVIAGGGADDVAEAPRSGAREDDDVAEGAASRGAVALDESAASSSAPESETIAETRAGTEAEEIARIVVESVVGEESGVPGEAADLEQTVDREGAGIPQETETSEPDPAVVEAPAPAPEPEAQRVAPETPADAGSSAAAEDNLAADSSRAPPEPSRFFLAQGIRAQEGGPAAAIEVTREGGIAWSATIVWWTTEDTARAGEDYADLGEQSETFAPGVESVTLYVPLVDDGIDEPPEGFLVSIGRPIPGSGRVETIATTGVIIQDDDNSPR